MSPQLPESVRSTMEHLTYGLAKILGDRLLAVYLGGSAAMGDFCDASSDLDFLVVTDGHLSPEDALAVQFLHRDLLRRQLDAFRLEGDYAPLHSLVPEGTCEPVPGCERGLFLPRVGEIMLSADNIANMREHGIAFYGPPARDLLPVVTPDQVRDAARAMLSQGLDPCDTTAAAASALLNLLRSVCALELGRPTTKSEGGAWGLTHLDSRWHEAIAAALACRSGAPTDPALLFGQLPTLERCLRERYVSDVGKVS